VRREKPKTPIARISGGIWQKYCGESRNMIRKKKITEKEADEKVIKK